MINPYFTLILSSSKNFMEESPAIEKPFWIGIGRCNGFAGLPQNRWVHYRGIQPQIARKYLNKPIADIFNEEGNNPAG